ncbi:enoyl-CoA hydratase/isomerase family protein [Immundisolibacter sp.]|uniref:enoyl-CoA hydratase/isomerase family protein n=1 Tax=Immundisolibacter sp. TaxID=1934948 RepID=UPI00263076E3|nr:enoyl-CoA hydratase/isomerase family protein [Immundisolibacter sp.]MDD3652091.1 enoyl-CoA hydratase/isomerase family protein [Immundisolibacter sp.]
MNGNVAANVLWTIDHRGVATLTLNRPQVHNAFDDVLIAELTERLSRLGTDPAVRALVLTGAGESFCAGGDLNWMRSMVDFSAAENQADALKLAQLLEVLDTLPKPTVARVNGSAFGGGVGLVACCDVAVGVDTARFGLTEVRLGLAPATIAPYVVRAMGARQARRYFLTGERFDAPVALRLGLLHEAVASDALDAAVERLLDDLLKGGPLALAACKRLVGDVTASPDRDGLKRDTAALIARLRVSDEGQEGLHAFFARRAPTWIR